MATSDDNRSEFDRNRDDARAQIDSVLASSPAFWVIVIILGAVGVGAIVMTFF
jgi:hypothetical protein